MKFVETSCKSTMFFSKSLLLIITDGRIRRMQMEKKAVFYYAVLAPPQAIGVTRTLP